MKFWPFVVAVGLLLTARAGLAELDRPEAVPARQSFSAFPTELAGGWLGRELPMDQRVLDVLRLTDYVQRAYLRRESANTAAPPVFLYVGYYESQRTGATYHSPKNCLPGAGWQFTQSEDYPIDLPGFGTAKVTRAVIEKGLERQVVMYWYQDRGRVIADEYSAKAYLIWDSWRRNRTDGALVRVSTAAPDGVEAASERVLSFAKAIWPHLASFMPA